MKVRIGLKRRGGRVISQGVDLVTRDGSIYEPEKAMVSIPTNNDVLTVCDHCRRSYGSQNDRHHNHFDCYGTVVG